MSPRRLFPILALGLALAAPVTAQEEAARTQPDAAHAATAAEIDALLADHVETERGDRASLRAFLQRPDVRRVAEEAGIDVRTAETAVASLDDAEAAMLAGRADRIDEAMAGGDDVIVISTTALIIGLLILLIVLVA